MKIRLIFMASGFGRRFGANKLAAPVAGRPLYAYGLKSLCQGAQAFSRCPALTVPSRSLRLMMKSLPLVAKGTSMSFGTSRPWKGWRPRFEPVSVLIRRVMHGAFFRRISLINGVDDFPLFTTVYCLWGRRRLYA